MAVPRAAGISSAIDRTAVRTVLDHGFGSGGPTSSASLVSALSISACWAPDGPAVTVRTSSQSLPSRAFRTGSRPVRRTASHATGQPTESDRERRRLNSTHLVLSDAVFFL